MLQQQCVSIVAMECRWRRNFFCCLWFSLALFAQDMRPIHFKYLSTYCWREYSLFNFSSSHLAAKSLVSAVRGEQTVHTRLPCVAFHRVVVCLALVIELQFDSAVPTAEVVQFGMRWDEDLRVSQGFGRNQSWPIWGTLLGIHLTEVILTSSWSAEPLLSTAPTIHCPLILLPFSVDVSDW